MNTIGSGKLASTASDMTLLGSVISAGTFSSASFYILSIFGSNNVAIRPSVMLSCTDIAV